MVLLLLAAMLAPQLQGQSRAGVPSADAAYRLGLAERIGARAEAQAHFADSERLAPYLTTAAKAATPQAKTPIKK